MDWPAIANKHGWQIGLGIIGLMLVVIGIRQVKGITQTNEVELISGTSPNGISGQTVVVDVGGAVNRPGVYRLDQGARVADALQTAGGMVASADATWVTKTLNQAEIVKDGVKIYIPWSTESDTNTVSANQSETKSSNSQAAQVNINTATLAELDNLWGVGAVRAQAIISHRPYTSLAELTTKAGVPQSVIDKNQGSLTVY